MVSLHQRCQIVAPPRMVWQLKYGDKNILHHFFTFTGSCAFIYKEYNWSMSEEDKKLVIFESHQVRRTWNDERWYFVVEDVVQALIESNDPKQYIQRMRDRDEQLSQGWVQIVHTLDVMTKGGRQKMVCADLGGIFRIIQSIPSPKAEPFKLWLAKIGKERIEEIKDPELAMKRAKAIFEKKGYPKSWIDKRMRGIAVRNTLTDEIFYQLIRKH